MILQTQNNNSKSQEEIRERIIKDPVARKNVAKNNFYWFFVIYFAHYIKYKTASFQKELFGLAQNGNNKMAVVSAFRGSGKSTILTTAYPVWAILGIQQKKLVYILSQTEDKAQQYLLNIKKELEENELLRADLGPFQAEHGQWGISALYIQNFNARIRIGSVGQSIRSARHQQHRPDLIIIDDCEDLAAVKTKESREKTYEWFKGEVLPAGDVGTRVIVIGNLLHQDCLVMRLRREIEENVMSGIVKWFPILDSKGTILWSGKYPDMAAIENERRKIGNEKVWKREYMLEIVADAEQIFLPEWFERYKYETMPSFDSPDYKRTYLGVDPAVSQKESSDKSGIVIASIFGSGKDMKIYIHPHTVNRQFRFHNLADEIVYLANNVGRKNRTIPVIEDVAAQKWLHEELIKRGIRSELFEVHGIEKAERLKIATMPVEAGIVYFPTHGIDELKIQLLGFGTERYDDLADAFGIVINKIMEERGVGEINLVRMDSISFSEFKERYYISGDLQKSGIVDVTEQMKPAWEKKGGKSLEESGRELDLKIIKEELQRARGIGLGDPRKRSEDTPFWFC